MSFNSRDLMIDVLPTQPGLILCGQATAGGKDEEEGALECGQATADKPKNVTLAEAGLALLKHQLHEALSAEARA
jgi:hypothetical protein